MVQLRIADLEYDLTASPTVVDIHIRVIIIQQPRFHSRNLITL